MGSIEKYKKYFTKRAGFIMVIINARIAASVFFFAIKPNR